MVVLRLSLGQELGGEDRYDTLGAHEGAGAVAPVVLHRRFGLIGISALSSEEALWFWQNYSARGVEGFQPRGKALLNSVSDGTLLSSRLLAPDGFRRKPCSTAGTL